MNNLADQDLHCNAAYVVLHGLVDNLIYMQVICFHMLKKRVMVIRSPPFRVGICFSQHVSLFIPLSVPHKIVSTLQLDNH